MFSRALLVLVALTFHLFPAWAQLSFDQKNIDRAIQNGKQVSEGFERSLQFVNGWFQHTAPVTGLILTNLDKAKDIWEPHNSAADNWSFMVLTNYLLDQDLYQGKMLEMLNTERKLTSRVKSLPDTWSFSKKGFNTEKPDMNWVIFGSTEYMKDGILPLCEYIGASPWRDRMTEILNDMPEYYTLFKDVDQLGSYKVALEEVNGDMLQTLVRNYWMTGRKDFLDWAFRIDDYYMLGERDLDKLKYLRLRAIVLRYPMIEDPRPMLAVAGSSQFLKVQDHPEAVGALAAIVAENITNLVVDNLLID